MKIIQIKLITVLVLLLSVGIQEEAIAQQSITMQSLLREMVDRRAITYFSESSYRQLQASSYNRESVSPDLPGWFADSDGEGFIRVEENKGKKEWVIMEDDGPGVITKIWAVCFYYGLNDTTGANINIYLDGNTEPLISTNFFQLIKGNDMFKPPFAQPTARAANLYFPIPYAKSCKITMDRKAFYNIINYRSYPRGTPVESFSRSTYKTSSKLIDSVAQELTSPIYLEEKTYARTRSITSGKSLNLHLGGSNKAISQLSIKLKKTKNLRQSLRSLVLAAKFDGEETVWAPLGDFFNNVGKLQAYHMWERSVYSDSTFVCRWLMPYHKGADGQLINYGEHPVEAELSVVLENAEWKENSMHFYAAWQMDDPTPTFPLYDWNFLEAKGQGLIVGDQWTVLNPVEGWWGEGDEKIYVDEDFENNFPSHFGTGTEDYYGWAGGVVPTPEDEFSQAFLGNIIVGSPRSQGYNVCSRTRTLDAIPFKQRLRFDVESSCGIRKTSHFLQYAQTTFWYAKPGLQHNRKPMPERAAQKLPELKDLQEKITQARANKFVFPGAIEAEVLAVNPSEAAVLNYEEIPVWGELSDGELKNIWMDKPGDYVEIKMSEQFEASHLKLAALVGPHSAVYRISVNGEVKQEVDLYSKHAGLTTPFIDLGECKPKDNTFLVKIELIRIHEKAIPVKSKFALGLDFFLVENNFLNR